MENKAGVGGLEGLVRSARILYQVKTDWLEKGWEKKEM